MGQVISGIDSPRNHLHFTAISAVVLLVATSAWAANAYVRVNQLGYELGVRQSRLPHDSSAGKQCNF